jgi:hypothetical protein
MSKTASKQHLVDLLNNEQLSNRLVMVRRHFDNAYISMPKAHVLDLLQNVEQVEYFRSDFIDCRGTVYLTNWS